MPGLAVSLTLNQNNQSTSVDGSDSQSESNKEPTNDLVAFISGLLLGSQIDVKNWLSQFIKCGQRVCINSFSISLAFYPLTHYQGPTWLNGKVFDS